MFEVNVASVGSVNVVSSDNGGLSNDQIADMAANKIIYALPEHPRFVSDLQSLFPNPALHVPCSLVAT